MKIILASASPRRRELLARMGLTFEVMPAKGEEAAATGQPSEAVTELAAQKAREIAGSVGGEALVIGADTVVVKDGRILGKPKDAGDARRMLSLLQGDTHEVYTGVCLIAVSGGAKTERTFYECTEVAFYPMTEREIADYVATGEPMDKAGAYGIQGKCAVYVRGIRGDYNNVVGLPVARLYQELKTFLGESVVQDVI